MIVRYGGGNDGIVDYLINGRKAERHTRVMNLIIVSFLMVIYRLQIRLLILLKTKVRNVICTLLCLFMKVMCRMKC